MPVFRSSTTFEMVRGIKTFLSLEVGATRGEVPNLRRQLESKVEQLQQTQRGMAEKDQKIAELQAKLAIERSNDQVKSLNPQNVIWIFGSIRSGSTWLRSIMGDLSQHQTWEEPGVGRLFGEFYTKAQTGNLRSPSFIMSDATREDWIRLIRIFVLDGARYANPHIDSSSYLVIKEPGGSSVGAPLLMEALPESCMVFLVRDPRDIMASVLDAAQEGGWYHEWQDKSDRKQGALPDRDPDTFIRRRSNTYLLQVGNTKKAFDAHKGRKVLVRYEDLRADTLGTMRRLYSELEIPIDEIELSRAVEKHSWENIPEEEKGNSTARLLRGLGGKTSPPSRQR